MQARIPTWVDAREGLQVHANVDCEAMVCTVVAHFDAERGELAKPFERIGQRCRVTRQRHGNDEKVSIESLRQGTEMIYRTLVRVAGKR